MLVLTLTGLEEATITKRPSKICKSPYMADIILTHDQDKQETMAHSPSLGCSGLTDIGSKVLVSRTPLEKKDKIKSSHKIQFSILSNPSNQLVCTHPAVAENVIEIALKNNMLRSLKVSKLQKQTTIGKSRFDFSGIDSDGKEFIAEVKTVPAAGRSDGGEEIIAFFPDGYIKSKDIGKKPQSERANKHIQELTNIKLNSKDSKRTIMFYVVQRGDARGFSFSPLDPIYLESCRIAKATGVELYAVQMKWLWVDGKVQGLLIGEEDVSVNAVGNIIRHNE